MRIGGMEVKGLNEVVLVLPRSTGDIVIKARAIPNFDEFDKLCPEPVKPVMTTKAGVVADESNPDYQAAVMQRDQLRIAYIYVMSLEPSQIEWDTVKLDEPLSWLNFRQDFQAAGMSPVEINFIWNAIAEANCLSEDKLKEARARFLAGQGQEPQASSGPSTAPTTTPSGEPASASA